MLLEREDSIEQLNRLCVSAQRGHGGIALVQGEAGIGKTSLLENLVSQVSHHYQIFWGRCDALFTPRPLGPLQDMAPQFGEQTRLQLSDQTDSSQLFSAILQELSTLRRGAVMVIEDVHWADNATLDFLNFLARRISLLPVLLIISFRDDEVHNQHPLTNVLGQLPSRQVTRILLTPLSPDAVKELGVKTGFAANELYNITAGNPFFIAELMEVRSANVGTIPMSIKDAINARMMRLFEGERKLLETICVIPGVISLNLLEKLFGEQAETLTMACVGRKLLIQEGGQRFRFRHELSRLAIVSRITGPQQKEIHKRVLNALLEQDNPKDVYSVLDQIVHHAAGATDGLRVLKFAPLAARKAAGVGAHKEAAAHLATALRFVDQASSELAADLYEDWAFEASLALRIDDQVLDALRVAITLRRSLNQLENVGKNLRLLSRLHWMRGEGSESIRYVDEATKVLESIPPNAELAMAYSVRSQSFLVNDQLKDAIYWGEKALTLAAQFKSEEVEIHALNNVGTARVYLGDLSGQQLIEKSLALSLASDRHADTARAYSNLAEFLVEFRQFGLAEKILAEGIAFSTQHDMIAKATYLQGILALFRLEQGRFQDALTISNGVMLAKQQDLMARLPALIVLAKTKIRLGHQDALEILKNALADAAQTGEIQFILPIRLGLIEYAWLENDLGLAYENLQALRETKIEQLHSWWLGEIFVWSARVGFAWQSFELEALPAPHQYELQKKYKQAAEQWTQIGMPYAAALSLIQETFIQEALIQVGSEQGGSKQESEIDNQSDIEDHLRGVQQSLTDLQAARAIKKLQWVCEQQGISELISHKRRGPYRSAKNHPIGLTKREQEILSLLAKGSSNKEIAKTLVRSQRTIENHVSTVLSKLNAKNRLEAMLRVHNEPWLIPDHQQQAEPT